MDISTKTAFCGSLGLLMMEIPIMKYFFVAGGLSYTLYQTLSNEAVDAATKMKQLGHVSVSALGSIGASVAGMARGQLLIPVPFLGAFIGGVIGGYVG